MSREKKHDHTGALSPEFFSVVTGMPQHLVEWLLVSSWLTEGVHSSNEQNNESA